LRSSAALLRREPCRDWLRSRHRKLTAGVALLLWWSTGGNGRTAQLPGAALPASARGPSAAAHAACFVSECSVLFLSEFGKKKRWQLLFLPLVVFKSHVVQ